MQRWLIVIGSVVLILGLAWPWLARLGLGRLPGDLFIDRGGLKLYFPLMTSLIVSVVVSLLLWLFRK